jgi:hypothetical protein
MPLLPSLGPSSCSVDSLIGSPMAAHYRIEKYLGDLHGNYAASEGNKTICTSYLAPSMLATAAASQVLGGTQASRTTHKVVRMAETFGPEGAAIVALEDQWIDAILCKGLLYLVSLLKQAEASGRMGQLYESIKADILLHRSFLRALPWWLEQQGSGYPLLN